MINIKQLLFLIPFLTGSLAQAQNFELNQSNQNYSNTFILNEKNVSQNTISNNDIQIFNIQPIYQSRGNGRNHPSPTQQIQTQINIELPKPKLTNPTINLPFKENNKERGNSFEKSELNFPSIVSSIELASSSPSAEKTKNSNYKNEIHFEKFWFKKKFIRPIKRFFIRNLSKQKKFKIKFSCSF